MSKVTKKDLLERIEILEQKEKQRGIGNNFMTLKCIQGNRTFTKDVTYAASKTFDSIVITNNFGSVKILEEITKEFGCYKVTHDTQTAVFKVIGTNVEIEPKLKQLDQSGSDLCRAILKNQVYQPCFVSDVSEAHAIERKQTAMIDKVYSGLPFIFRSGYNGWSYVVPINNQGEPLTAADAGL